ncbi:MAG TPA: Asp-tRNA(Asn)/Glu-tRNA(Gln) amidotransferase subunit GatB [Patescibacteria group bacterium]
MTQYVPVIGMEIHAELTTRTKLFCRCSNTSSDLETPPNTAVCPVCLGLPGALPVLNKRAVEATVQLGRSLGCTIPAVTKWDRKNYFYPDLPKSYQISQYDQPLCSGGELVWFDRAGERHTVALTRIHLEEDTGKLMHPAGKNYSLIDYNRSSIPLLELVSEPVITSAQQAKQFAEEYQHRLRELGIAEASMEKGQMRVEANISVIPAAWQDDPEKRLTGVKIEIKNLNSFRAMERAVLYEIDRQSRVLNEGGTLRQETRGWNDAKGETYVMRTKETADDYRYFPDPDLRPLDLSWLEEEGTVTPFSARSQAFEQLLNHGVDPKHVHTITGDPDRLAFFTRLALVEPEAIRLAVQWLNNEPRLTQFSPEEVRESLELLGQGSVSATLFKQALADAQPGGLKHSLERVTASNAIDDLAAVVAKVLQENEAEVARYRAGEEKLLGFFVGQLRQALQGKGDPGALVSELKKQLS